mmetsp:Transcript_37728/g.84060  ORF Transcript_37728/g.84060 Transcript_37728/m.84060 type:complete len:895 (-) Transcript_37728:499-3183(-)|eukprot:CAMPEP_0202922888 /NCGR_PEP_ID=MMETSP1392-20130828/78161_1 /ASSEMBLY_ACC=CAM_ASM_000868 /TAXON_ID=225041 /ORGANISM="Chlamydomonas chlamydogama, Strain SAG 11-48b" /LENGTH=894 /DNA_ID=CAMNT_0049616541 /DNA_START=111 /DNA_END=2795 /DNA_ORIENTATION=+
MAQSHVVLLVVTLFFVLNQALAFKEHEFKKCKDTGFCRRNRGKTGPTFNVLPDTVQLTDLGMHTFGATLVNQAANKQLQLTIKAYTDGAVRIKVDEDESVGRYKISDILLPEVEQRLASWKIISKSAHDIWLQFGKAQLNVKYTPFSASLTVDGKPAIQLNSRNLFNFEHRREKDGAECDGCWEETFLQHQDSKPKGPEAISLDIFFPGADHVYGIPERATNFSLPATGEGEPYRLYNLDVFEYLDQSPFGLYGTIPVMLAHKAGLTTGVFWLNAAEMFVDVAHLSDGTSTQWIAESGIVDLFLFVGPTPGDVIKQYSALTGTTAMPQLFSIGYHQCRWNYRDEADAHAVDAGFDQHEIPYDVLWLDIEHTNGKRYLTWDSSVFPNPVAMQEDIASRGRKMVTIVDPHVKRDPSYYIFSEAEKAGHYVKNKGGGDFDGWCWPGSSSYLDVTSPAVRQWWAEQFDLSKYQGSTKHLYIWNDMNEPSVFNGPEITMHKDNLHYGNVEHRDVHNLYGLYYHMGTAEGLKLRGYRTYGEDGDRPFVLSRAFFSGTQQVGPIWTGDNAADWKHLAVSIPMLLTLGVTGLPFSGADVGGFFGNPDAELLTRWYQVGIYYPFFRGHAHLETQRREPWLFGEPTTTHIREAIRARYALLPYMYTLFRAANTSGLPVVRPLWFEFPHQKDIFSEEKQFLLGAGLMIAPVTTPGATTVEVKFPGGARWYDVMSGAEQHSSSVKVPVTMQTIPAFYRGGHIIPRRERPRRSTATMANDPFTLVIALDDKLHARGDLYVDDGRSFAFLRGQYVHRDFSFDGSKLVNSKHAAEAGVPEGVMDVSGLVIERVVFLGLKGKSLKAKLPDGTVIPLEAGPLNMRTVSTHASVLRKPNLPIGSDWTVEITK